ncbi:MAG: hypothetical protein GY894_04280 [Planctomycetes bacterium]|nr:hypothetical protein [Planctomycetota bacterium]
MREKLFALKQTKTPNVFEITGVPESAAGCCLHADFAEIVSENPKPHERSNVR